jgi:hypothetical protein
MFYQRWPNSRSSLSHIACMIIFSISHLNVDVEIDPLHLWLVIVIINFVHKTRCESQNVGGCSSKRTCALEFLCLLWDHAPLSNHSPALISLSHVSCKSSWQVNKWVITHDNPTFFCRCIIFMFTLVLLILTLFFLFSFFFSFHNTNVHYRHKLLVWERNIKGVSITQQLRDTYCNFSWAMYISIGLWSLG